MLPSGCEDGYQSATVRKILRLLEGLRETATGKVLYGHIQQMLDEQEASHCEIQRSYASIASLLLDAYSTHLAGDSPLLAQIKMLQMRLAPPLSQSEVTVLHRYMEAFADQITQYDDLGAKVVERALAPLLSEFGFNNHDDRRVGDRRSNDRRNNVHYLGLAPLKHVSRGEGAPAADPHVYGEEASQLRDTLSSKLNEAIAQSEEFSVVLEVELASLRETEDAEGFEERKKVLGRELERVLEGHRQLMQHFYHISNYLALLETDSRRLSAELNRAMLLSLTDELTGLSNRRAFMQRLEDELSRAQRYGHSVSVAIIDIDRFKDINDQYGHAVGDTVLREYAQQVLNSFRHHDMVARYGGEEFAVIFPNTGSEGALQALRKVQRLASDCPLEVEKISIKLPSFSAGLAVYEAGEPLRGLIKRADQALYRAKELGRQRIEIAETEAAVEG